MSSPSQWLLVEQLAGVTAYSVVFDACKHRECYQKEKGGSA